MYVYVVLESKRDFKLRTISGSLRTLIETMSLTLRVSDSIALLNTLETATHCGKGGVGSLLLVV